MVIAMAFLLLLFFSKTFKTKKRNFFVDPYTTDVVKRLKKLHTKSTTRSLSTSIEFFVNGKSPYPGKRALPSFSSKRVTRIGSRTTALFV